MTGRSPAQVPALRRGGRAGRRRPTRWRRCCAVCNDARVPVTAPPAAAACAAPGAGARRRRARPSAGSPGIVSVDAVSLVRRRARRARSATDLEDELRAEHGAHLGHWPQSIDLSTVGGWLACRGAGQHSTRYGKIEDMVVGLEVVLADGRVVRTGGAPRPRWGPTSTSCSSARRARSASSPAPGCGPPAARPHERRAAYTFASFAAGLDACRRILHARRHARPCCGCTTPPSRRASGTGDGTRCTLLVLDEGDPTLVDATMAIVDRGVRRRSRPPTTLVDALARAPQRHLGARRR